MNEDVSEQCRHGSFATKQTKAKLEKDQLHEWLKDGTLNDILFESAVLIRKSWHYVCSDVEIATTDYESMDIPMGSRTSGVISDAPEPEYVNRYFKWWDTLRERGLKGQPVVNLCVHHIPCDRDYAVKLLKLF